MLIPRTISREWYSPVFERLRFALPSEKERRNGFVCLKLSYGRAKRCQHEHRSRIEFPEGEGHLPLPERCCLNIFLVEVSEAQEALAIAIEETLYVVSSTGIELQALDGVTVAPDCRVIVVGALQNVPERQVPSEMNPSPR